MLHLFEFGDDESCDIPLELKQVREHAANVDVGSVPKQKLTLSNGSSSSDKLMQSLIDRHHPRWIANYHEHERVSCKRTRTKSYQKKSRKWCGKCTGDLLNGKRGEKRQHVSTSESLSKQKPVVSSAIALPPEDSNLVFSMGSSRCRLVPRKCTNLSHLLTLRSQGTKWGCSTVCGECA